MDNSIRLTDEEIAYQIKYVGDNNNLPIESMLVPLIQSCLDAQLAKLASLTPGEVREDVKKIVAPIIRRNVLSDIHNLNNFSMEFEKRCDKTAKEILAITNRVDRVEEVKKILCRVYATGFHKKPLEPHAGIIAKQICQLFTRKGEGE